MSKSKVEAPIAAPVVPVTDEVVITAGKAEGAVCPHSVAAVLYTTKEGSAYNPRVSHTQEAWSKVQDAMGVKQQATHKQLCDALAAHFTRTGENHHDFIGYMVRRGAMSVVINK